DIFLIKLDAAIDAIEPPPKYDTHGLMNIGVGERLQLLQHLRSQGVFFLDACWSIGEIRDDTLKSRAANDLRPDAVGSLFGGPYDGASFSFNAAEHHVCRAPHQDFVVLILVFEDFADLDRFAPAQGGMFAIVSELPQRSHGRGPCARAEQKVPRA